jgi:formate dehydrogenase
MKKGVIIVNNARGAIMDTQAVADACATGHIAGMYWLLCRPHFHLVSIVVRYRKKPCSLDWYVWTVVCVWWSGYGGDVWHPQPAPRDHPWRYMPNNAMTPHISGTTIDGQVSRQ